MKHGLAGRVVDSPYSTFRRLVAEGVYPEGRAGRDAALTCGAIRFAIAPYVQRAAVRGVRQDHPSSDETRS
jgi:hypothetical protein